MAYFYLAETCKYIDRWSNIFKSKAENKKTKKKTQSKTILGTY